MKIIATLAATLALAVLTVASFATTAGCGDNCGGAICDACAPALTMTFVDDTTGTALAGVTIDHPSGRCDESGGTTTCYIDEFGGGSVHFVAGLTGYQGLNVQEDLTASEPGGCCNCGYLPRTVELRLIPQ